MTDRHKYDTADTRLRKLHRVFPGQVSIYKWYGGSPWRERFSIEIADPGRSPIVWVGGDVSKLIAKAYEWMRTSW